MFDEAQRYPITTILCVGAVAAFAAQLSGRSVDHMVLSSPLLFSEPWRLLTTIFPHGNIVHILFNLLWTWQLGRVLEARLGSPGMVVLALVTALSASALQVVFGGRPVGLSGVVYGLAAYAWMRGRKDPAYAGIIDDSTRNLLVAWFFICIGLTWIGAMNVANAAHAGGALIGLALGTGRPWLTPLVMTLIGTATLFRVLIPFHDPNAGEYFRQGVLSLQDGRDGDAEAFFEEATRRAPTMAEAWFNVGVMKQRRGDLAGSQEAFLEAARLDLTLFEQDGNRQAYAELLRQREAQRARETLRSDDGDSRP